jgi:hypothetical protein
MKHKKHTNKLNQHQELVQNLSTYFKQLLDSISSKQCLIVQDYTTIHEDSKNKNRVLNLTVYTKSTTHPIGQLTAFCKNVVLRVSGKFLPLRLQSVFSTT